MSDLDAIRAERLVNHSASTNFAEAIVKHIDWCVKNFQISSILVRSAEQNTHVVRAKIIEYVAKIEGWEHIDVHSYSTFEVAINALYLKHNIFIREEQKEMSSPDYSFMSMDISGFTKIFYDLELNATDPYFGTITRSYYNDVNS